MKPGNFTQLHIQLVFAVKYREALLRKEIRENVFEYIAGIITTMGHKTLIVNGFSDHVHIFMGMNPKISISDTIHDVKRNSSLFINNNSLCQHKFAWQNGYGAFSYSHSHIKNVYNYIKNQESHHTRKTFQQEYMEFLEKFEVPYDERFLFDFFDE
jgi:REP element-mobilizing transposase RayT